MDAIVVRAFGGPEQLVLKDVPVPEPGPGQVRVRLAAVGVNYVDVYVRTGYQPGPLPRTPGTEGAGTVVAVGPDVESVRVGDRVASVDLDGSYAQQALVAADRVVPLPVEVSEETAAAALLQGLTAHYLLLDSYPVKSGDVVLVHAAAGGMGLMLTQLATRLGATVIGTASTEEKERLARDAGASEVIRYGPLPQTRGASASEPRSREQGPNDVDVAAEVRRLTGGTGVAAVYDGVGRSTFDASLASLRIRGTLVLYGAASGPVPPFDPQRLQQGGSLFLTRPTLKHHIFEAPELARRSRDLFGWLADGVNIRIHDRYPLAEARRAHEDLEARRTAGKLLLEP